MKNQANKTRSLLRAFITPVAFACALMVSTISTAVYANEKKEASAASSTSAVKVKYLGEIDKQPVLQIDISNLKQEELFVTLRDETGYKIYSEKFSGNIFSKKFQFTDVNLHNLQITLSVEAKKSKNSQVFQINNVTTMVEDVVITKID